VPLSDVSGGARAAGGIEDEVAGARDHVDAALDDLLACLDYICLLSREATSRRVVPYASGGSISVYCPEPSLEPPIFGE
jgi:hypothetical protein